MNIMKKFSAVMLIVAMTAGTAFAEKWQELIFTEDINMGLAELSQYCMLHDITVADVLWANSIESGDIKPGQSVYLPANQADMLAIWQNRGAWKPTALIPVNSAAAAKRAVNGTTKPAEVHAPKTEAPKTVPEVKADVTVASVPEPEALPETKTEVKPEVKKSGSDIDDIMAQFRSEIKANTAPAAPVKQAVREPAVTPAAAQTVKQTAPIKQETPAKVIAKTAKPDKILASSQKKSKSKNEIPGLMDPIIILSPNGDPSKGPMRLVISGDKVEVVQLPRSAAPKRPSLSDLDHTFGTSPSYLPHYNMTAKPRDPFILNMGNLAGKMLWPVDGKVSSPFGKWRGRHKHQGIDIPMPGGTPIRAARNGVVSRTGNNSTMGFRGYGNFVLMDHGDGLQTFYAHCSSVAVVQGQRIMQGQIIGYVGSTGRSTANHLHFEVRINSTKVDPMPYLGGNMHYASHK